MLDKILKIRLLFKNKENIKQLYFNNFNKKEIINYTNEELNFDILDKRKQFIPYYNPFPFEPIKEVFIF